MIQLPIELNKSNQATEYNLHSTLKEKGLLDEKGRFIVAPTSFVSEERLRGKNIETSKINAPYQHLTETEIAILLKLWFIDGALAIIDDELIIEYYV